MIASIARLIAATILMACPAAAQDSVTRVVPRAPAAAVPFGVGELLEYDIKYGKLHVGSGSMEIMAMDTVRGHDVWHTVFRLRGGIPFYRVNDKYEAWFDTRTLASLRYWQDIDEGSYEPKRHYEIYPERREFVEGTKDPRPSVERPLDEASMLYFLRTVPLRVGMDTSFNDYFMADRNPIRIRVLRVDTISVPAGQFSAIVVNPTFPSKLFSEGGGAEVWLSNDENRIMLQMKSKVSFGSLSLYLKSYRPSPATTTPLHRVKKE
jgi:Protein of unknown function (DUF3108)